MRRRYWAYHRAVLCLYRLAQEARIEAAIFALVSGVRILPRRLTEILALISRGMGSPRFMAGSGDAANPAARNSRAPAHAGR